MSQVSVPPHGTQETFNLMFNRVVCLLSIT